MKTGGPVKYRFLSLFWKTIIAVSIATLTASSGIVFVGKLTLENNYNAERQRAQRFFQQALDSTLQRSKRQEINIGWLMPTFIDSQADNQQALEQINKLISKNWFKIELESDIQSTLLFKHDKTIINQWGIPQQSLEDFDPWLEYVIKNEQPLDRIKCHNTCIHYFVRPFLHQGEFIGIFIFGIDLSEIILQMKDVTGAGIGVLVNVEPNQDGNDKKSLPLWSKKLMSLTDFDRNRVLINKFMKLYPEIPKNSVFIEEEGKQFEFTFLPLSDSENQATLLVIDDISEQRAELQKAQLLYLANGLISLVLSGGILLLLFIKPMRRIRILISSLPLIAKKQYSEAEKNILAKDSRRIKDEIDILSDATHDLLLTSKQLDDEINQHTHDLSERTNELLQEQNFIKHILNTAQVIILTLNQQGEILTLNKYTENLTGFKFKELLKQSFYAWMQNSDDTTDISQTVSEFGFEQRKHYQKDCLIVSATGEELYISWFFTLLDNQQKHPEILAVGLDLSERKKVENQLLWLADHDS
ncbi:MAG: PAS domain S-box protein, partial [Endozoicomonadaceae bacterium]|nr:PAS domain S-box protein [Endozoicomonadaceae bacterium]